MKVFFRKCIVYVYEAFANHGNVNLWNLHYYWASNNPNWTRISSLDA